MKPFLPSVSAKVLAGAGFLLSFLTPNISRAVGASSEIVGFTVIPCLGSSDTVVSTPLARPATFVSAGTGTDITALVTGKITFSGAPFVADQFKYVAGSQSNTYFAFIGNGAKEGDYFTITGNDTNSVTVELKGDTLAAVTAGTTVKITPFWTLGTLFPNGSGVTPTTGFRPATQILLPNTLGSGTNLAAAGTYTYSGAGATWLKSGSSGSANDTVLAPDNYFTVRNNTTAQTKMTVVGSVVVTKVVVGLATNAVKQQDNFVAVIKPLTVTLNDSGLITSGAFVPSSGFTVADQLYVFDNSVAQLNKAASRSYIYSNGAWHRFGETTDAGADTVFTPGTGVLIRKAKKANAPTAMWVVPKTVVN